MTKDENTAIRVIFDYEMYMSDPWRNDFSENGEKDDEDRKQQTIAEIMEALGCGVDDAEHFFDAHYIP